MRAHPYRELPSSTESDAGDGEPGRLLAAEWIFASAFWLTSVACAASIMLGGKLGAEGTLALIVVIGFPVLFFRLRPHR